jgi:hypothetical protein
MGLDTDLELPKRFPSAGRMIAVAGVVLLAVAAVAGFSMYFLGNNGEPPAPPPAPSTEHRLTDVEALGVEYSLNMMGPASLLVSGTVTDGNVTVSVNLTYKGDRTVGAGRVTAGRDVADAVLDQNVVFLKGGPGFWRAVGVTISSEDLPPEQQLPSGVPAPGEEGTEGGGDKNKDPAKQKPPVYEKWIALDPRFMSDKLFLSSATVSAVLKPVGVSTMDGNRYVPNPGEPDWATFAPNGIDHYSVTQVDVSVVPLAEDAAGAAAAPGLAARTEWGGMEGSPGAWKLTPTAPEPPAP